MLCCVVFRNSDVPAPFTFDGPSDKLTKSEIVPSLESTIPDGKNTIWCASFQAAWWALRDLAGEPVTLEGSPAVVKLLNDSPDPRSHIPPQALFVAAGWNDQGITNQIRKDFENRFPNQKAPSFPGILPGAVVSYSLLQADVKFDLPYDQNERPLLFTEGGEQKSKSIPSPSSALSAINSGSNHAFSFGKVKATISSSLLISAQLPFRARSSLHG